MNLYLRYFDNETLVSDVEQALSFLQSIPDIMVDDYLANDLRQFVEGSVMYPKRYKVKTRAYFIVIKTNATTLEEFKEIGAQGQELPENTNVEKQAKQSFFSTTNPGWYEATINFKRVITHPETRKSQYCDTEFVARVKADSIQECYNKIIDHLRSRADVDPRSQFPSIKGKQFACRFLGEDLN